MEPSTSPLPKSVDTMDFGEAMKKVVSQKKVHKLEWSDKEYYVFLDEDRLKIHNLTGNHDWIISLGDLNGDDYVVLED